MSRLRFVLVGLLVAGSVSWAQPASAAVVGCGIYPVATITGSGTINGTPGDDVILGSAGVDTINGLGGNDTICGAEGNDILNGGDGDDTIHGDSSNETAGNAVGNDSINGGNGSDWVDYSESFYTVNVSLPGGTSFGEGNDPLTGIENIMGSNVETLTGLDDFLGGDAQSNLFFGGLGDDYIYGRDGDDIIEAGLGNDAVVAGAGNFDFVTHFLAGPVSVDLMAQTATGDGTDNLKGVELLAGSCYSDVLRGDSRTNWMIGGPNQALCSLLGRPNNGNDVLDGRGGADVAVYFLGEAGVNANLAQKRATGAHEGTDTLTKLEGLWGSNANDVMTGDGADNTVVAGLGNDTLRGGGGDDYLYDEGGTDKMYGDGGRHDVLSFAFSPGRVNVDMAKKKGTGVSVISGIEGIDGSVFGDTIYGNGGANYLWGGAGADRLFGRGGGDKLDGSGGSNRLNGGPGSDGCVKGRKSQCENATTAPTHPLDEFADAVSRFKFKRFKFK